MDDAKDIRKGEELNWDKLESYLRDHMLDLKGEMTVAQFHGGHANLTYLLKFGDNEYVLRRPPFGKIAPGAHDMKREYRVLSKLYEFFPQAPRAFHLCTDPEVIGATFVVMERRKGIVVRYSLPDIFKKFNKVEQRLTEALMKAEAALHNVNVTSADLVELGRPEGFLNRQLDGWIKRWELSKVEENIEMNEVYEILSSDLPVPQAVSIIHNDIKFDNCQFQENNPDKVTSIFDWDMATLGDPLVDFGVSLSYWPEEKVRQFKNLPVTLKGDFPNKEFLKEKYAQYSGFNLENIAWYESLAYWKGAVIAQQLYRRFVNGATKDKRMAAFGDSAKALASIARQIANDI